jgi:hypothetical protein
MLTRKEISSSEEKEERSVKTYFCPRCEERRVINDGDMCYICKEVIDE